MCQGSLREEERGQAEVSEDVNVARRSREGCLGALFCYQMLRSADAVRALGLSAEILGPSPVALASSFLWLRYFFSRFLGSADKFLVCARQQLAALVLVPLPLIPTHTHTLRAGSTGP